LWRLGAEHAARLVKRVDVPVTSAELQPYAGALGRRVSRFGWAIERTIARYKEGIIEAQYAHERIADAAVALYTASCTLARLDHQLASLSVSELDRQSAELYLRTANRRFDQAHHDLSHNDDPQTTRTADAALRGVGGYGGAP
jgi:acyl-CoA dehydrogenase family member 9